MKDILYCIQYNLDKNVFLASTRCQHCDTEGKVIQAPKNTTSRHRFHCHYCGWLHEVELEVKDAAQEVVPGATVRLLLSTCGE